MVLDTITSDQLVEVSFPDVGWYVVDLTEYDQGASSVRSFQDRVVCRYVRREIRSLFPEDQSLFFDVLEIMYRTSWSDGQSKYGNVWRNAGAVEGEGRERLRG